VYWIEFLQSQGATARANAPAFVGIPVDKVPPTNATSGLVRLERQYWSAVVEQWELPLAELIEREDFSWLGRFQRELSKFASLPVGWNSYDAQPPGRNSIDAAHSFLGLLAGMPDVTMVPSRIAPIADGGVAVSFLKNDFRACIDYLESGEVVAVIARRGSESVVWDIEGREELEEAVRRIASALPKD